MPTDVMMKELNALGVKSGGQKKCPRCGKMVEVWGSAKFNLADHPTSPSLLHELSCGDPDEPPMNPLPPVPTQHERGSDDISR